MFPKILNYAKVPHGLVKLVKFLKIENRLKMGADKISLNKYFNK